MPAPHRRGSDPSAFGAELGAITVVVPDRRIMTNELPYDGDLNDPKQRCRHGTFIGSWWGPDYLCYWCESGEEPEPEPDVVLCDHADHYTDFDGSAETAECQEPAKHTVDVGTAHGSERVHLCSQHLSAMFAADTVTVMGDDIWLDKHTLLKRVHIGKVLPYVGIEVEE